MGYWNDKEYKTYADIRTIYGFYEREVVIHIEDCLKDGSLFAYYENYTGTKLINYEKTTLEAGGFFLFGHYNDDYDGTFHGADNLMFFEEKLEPHDLVFRPDMPSQKPAVATDSASPPAQSNRQAWDKALESAHNTNPLKHQKLHAYYLRYWQTQEISAIEQQFNVSKKTAERMINDGREIAKAEQLFLPENDEKRDVTHIDAL